MLPAVLDEKFEKRMKQAETDVAREFSALDPELVHEEFRRVADDLLRNARVKDFVPVLARRHVRDHLRSLPAAVQPAPHVVVP